jgi:hypothetical protein
MRKRKTSVATSRYNISRDRSSIARRSLALSLSRSYSPVAFPDYRSYHPRRVSHPTFSGVHLRPRAVLARPKRAHKPSKRLHRDFNLVMQLPKQAAVCVRRHERREVLFAKNRVGRGRSVRPPRYNQTSKVSCHG